jgi:ligand-binding sensor domain-containing protein
MKALLTGLFTFLFLLSTFAQSPPYFSNTVENGAPSNEMYWVHQDRDGYIWIGCDAGVYRFNGIRYEHFTSNQLTARSATGLIQSKTTGRIYAYNFNRQFFFVENEKLKVIKGWERPVNGLADDGKGTIWITSGEGLFAFNEHDQSIKQVRSDKHISGPNGITFTAHGISSTDNAIWYQNGNKIFRLKDKQETFFQLEKKYAAIQMMLSRFSLHPWIVSLTGDKIYRFVNGKYSEYADKYLIQSLLGKKINCVFESTDGKLWIGTYTGLICHDPILQKTEVFHPQFSFSFGIQDKEGNYWFTTLHNGLIRIPNLEIRSWKSLDEKGSVEQFTHICTDNRNIFLGGTNGFISVLKEGSISLEKFSHLPLSDLGALYYDEIDDCVYLNKISQLYRFKNGKFDLINNNSRTVKSMLHTPEGYFILTSQGLFFIHSLVEPIDERNMIDLDWYRDIVSSPFSSSYFTASNSGLHELVPAGHTYKLGNKYLKGKQVISLTSDPVKKIIYFFSFDGGLYSIDRHKKIKKIKQWENDIRILQIRYSNHKIYMASNKGILVYDPATNREFLFNRFNGLSTNNIRSLTFQGSVCWAAGESIQQIPLSAFTKGSHQSEIRARKILINGESVSFDKAIEIDYKDKLSLMADGICYRSNGTFQFAYRINETNSNWIKVPGSVDKIDFASLPTGNITIELKLIDHEGTDSVNILRYKVYVHSPFWQRWWFYLLIILLVAGSAFLIFRSRLIKLRKKQQQVLKELKLENELRLTQQNALKAQMNPHFLFNVLNSIKGYIYENDKKNAARYLSDFSSLVRKVLELSSLPSVSLEQELEALKLYIDLEAMLLQSDFQYRIQVEENVDLSGIQVPALLLQPYVENAFKHGLRHKTGPKRILIKITMDEENGVLTIEINDNGIGRKASGELNAVNREEHQSFATSAMEKRIELLNHGRKELVGVEISDKFEGEEAVGTTVTIRIHV